MDNKHLATIVALFTCLILFSCEEKQQVTEVTPSEPESLTQTIEEPVKEEPKIEEPEIIIEEPVIEKEEIVVQVFEEPVKEEPKIEEPVIEPVIEDEPEVIELFEEEPQNDVDMEEFARSIGETVDIDVDTFAEDKKQILEIINALSKIMEDFDYISWLKYLDNNSATYYQKPDILKKTSAMIPGPVKRNLRSLQDYFKYVFIPSRKNSEVKEIRYNSSTEVKAVDVKQGKDGEPRDVVYYHFKKINGKWMLHLPPLEN